MDFKKIYKHDVFANETGAILDELTDERAMMHLTVEPRHLNGGRVVHGGVVFLLADISMAAMANQHNPISVSIQSDIRFLATAVEGDVLTAEAVLVYGRKRMTNCRVTISNQRGETIAIAEGMFHLAGSIKVEQE
ncbi:MAG: hotdog fold thioesterase [Rikenellaceae bacterium]